MEETEGLLYKKKNEKVENQYTQGYKAIIDKRLIFLSKT